MLDPQAQRFLAELEALGGPAIEDLDPVTARAGIAAVREHFAGARESVAAAEDRSFDGPRGPIPIRIYRPGGSGSLPVLVYFHGGGWVLGDLEMVDGLARAITNAAGCIVVSVDYRLAPEHPFPAPFDDAFAAADWVVRNAASLGGDPARVAVGGDSAGGNLAAAVCLAARDRNGPRLVAQLLIYPVVDRNFERPSFSAYADGYFLTTSAMRWFWDHYAATPEDAENPYAAPLRAPSLRDLPPAIVVIAGYDPLADEGTAYAQRLRAAGNHVDEFRYDGMLHGFMVIGTFDRATEAIADSCRALRAAFAATVPTAPTAVPVDGGAARSW